MCLHENTTADWQPRQTCPNEHLWGYINGRQAVTHTLFSNLSKFVSHSITCQDGVLRQV
jgi:hypothetical protein